MLFQRDFLVDGRILGMFDEKRTEVHDGYSA